ncbi:TPA: hypothetical protein ACV5PF_004104 [Bacillus cereus]
MEELEFNDVKKLARDIQAEMDIGKLRIKKIYSVRNGKEVKYVIDVLELDKEEAKNSLSVKVDVDTKEANENIRELTAAANECVEAFEKLEKLMGRCTNKSGLISSGVVDLTLEEKLYLAGRGPLPVERD